MPTRGARPRSSSTCSARARATGVERLRGRDQQQRPGQGQRERRIECGSRACWGRGDTALPEEHERRRCQHEVREPLAVVPAQIAVERQLIDGAEPAQRAERQPVERRKQAHREHDLLGVGPERAHAAKAFDPQVQHEHVARKERGGPARHAPVAPAQRVHGETVRDQGRADRQQQQPGRSHGRDPVIEPRRIRERALQRRAAQEEERGADLRPLAEHDCEGERGCGDEERRPRQRRRFLQVSQPVQTQPCTRHDTEGIDR